jgi:hypothetical protein
MNRRIGQRKRGVIKANQKPDTAKDTRNIAEQEQRRTDQPAPQAALSRPPIDQPKPSRKQTQSDQNEKHWLDYAIGAFAFLAGIGGISAAIFSGWQAWIASDNEHRYLRAYLHPIIDDEPVDLDKDPIEWTYWLKNYGLTPACHVRTSGQLFPSTLDFALDKKPDLINHYGTEPSYCVAPQEKHRIVLYLSINHPDRKLSDSEKDMIKWGAALQLFAHGTIYYDDVWNDPHVTDYRTQFGGNLAMRTGKMDWSPEGNRAR